MTESDRSRRYPPRDALQTRVASSDSCPLPDDAPTTLDGVRFTDAMLADLPASSAPRDVDTETRPAAVPTPVPDPSLPARPRASGAWVLMGAIAVVGGLLGGLLGVWLALR